MKGTCEECKAWHKKGILDYCCLRCTLSQGGYDPYIRKEKGIFVVDIERKVKDEDRAEKKANN